MVTALCDILFVFFWLHYCNNKYMIYNNIIFIMSKVKGQISHNALYVLQCWLGLLLQQVITQKQASLIEPVS